MQREELNVALIQGVNDGRLVAKVGGMTIDPDAHEKLLSDPGMGFRAPYTAQIYRASDVTYSVPS